MCDASFTCSLLLFRVLFISHSCLLRLLLLLGTEFVELAEAVAVDNLGETTVGIVADEAGVVEDHDFSVFLGVGVPGGEGGGIRVACLCELCPDGAHGFGELEVGGCGLGQVAAGVVEGVEAKLEFLAVDAAVGRWRAPCEHIHPCLGFAGGGYGVGGDEGLGTEEPVDAQQVLGCVVGVCFAECADVVVGLGAEGGSEFLTCLLHGDGLVVAQALQFVECGADEDGYVGRYVGKSVLEWLLQE